MDFSMNPQVNDSTYPKNKSTELTSGLRINNAPSPTVAVGGVGGSGTRVVAKILSDSGIQIGEDLNFANDNLLFTFIFRRAALLTSSESEFNLCFSLFKKLRTVGKSVLTGEEIKLLHSLGEKSPPQFDHAWCNKRLSFMVNKKIDFPEYKPWGWKEPNTHLHIDRILKLEPTLKYLHIMRNGLDMAYSGNQNQLELWGTHVFDHPFEINPHYSLKYWRLIHERMNEVSKKSKYSVYIVNFDKLCRSPKNELKKIFEFLDLQVSTEDLLKHINEIHLPSSVGRHKLHSLHNFDKSDIEFVQMMGF